MASYSNNVWALNTPTITTNTTENSIFHRLDMDNIYFVQYLGLFFCCCHSSLFLHIESVITYVQHSWQSIPFAYSSMMLLVAYLMVRYKWYKKNTNTITITWCYIDCIFCAHTIREDENQTGGNNAPPAHSLEYLGVISCSPNKRLVYFGFSKSTIELICQNNVLL